MGQFEVNPFVVSKVSPLLGQGARIRKKAAIDWLVGWRTTKA